jgi:Zn finger protein HypA/HybF involved in hydrogenase expression
VAFGALEAEQVSSGQSVWLHWKLSARTSNHFRHAETSDHPLVKTHEMAFLCKKCKKAFRKDMQAYDGALEAEQVSSGQSVWLHWKLSARTSNHFRQQGARHAETSDHPLVKTHEMAFLCKKCKKAFRKDMQAYEESDEYCPHCDSECLRTRR